MLDLPESLDVLDAHWRLGFDKKMRLLSLGVAVASTELSLDCLICETSHSRLSALADTFDRFKVDDDLLPTEITKEERTGSLDPLESCLAQQLPAELFQDAQSAVQTLLQVRRLRNAMQHTGADYSPTAKLVSRK
jgi:hypothetical protein